MYLLIMLDTMLLRLQKALIITHFNSVINIMMYS